MSVLTVKPTFLYPTSRQFPFDEVAEKIVRAIEKRNWKVPGIKIEFDTYGTGEAKYQKVRSITGNHFNLYFSRIQNHPNRDFYNTAALSSISIPKQIMTVYHDESGPTYYLYVGNNWHLDKDWFFSSLKVHSKLNNEPKRYLKYSGKTYNKRVRAKELFADNDLNREYSPCGDEPTSINLEQKFDELTMWLEKYVLNYILNFKEADVIEPPVPPEELTAYEGPWDTIFSICNFEDAQRINKGKIDPNELPPKKRTAYFGSGHRLVSLGIPCNDMFPKIAYDGFIWCDTNQEHNYLKNIPFIEQVESAMLPFSREKYIVAIKLKYANHVYIVDNSKYEETREELFKSIAPRDRLTDEELNSAIASRGATIIPITEYKGNYKEPIVLINRELDFEEISWITKI